MFSIFHRACKGLVPCLHHSASPAAVALRLQWRLVHAELGLAAWIAQVAGPRETQANDTATLVAAIDLDGARAPSELADMRPRARPAIGVAVTLCFLAPKHDLARSRMLRPRLLGHRLGWHRLWADRPLTP